MPYTDRQNRALSKIAYFDLADRYQYYANGGMESVPLELLLTKDDKKELQALYGSKAEMEADLRTWSLAGAYDTNDENGFCGYIIETGGGEIVDGVQTRKEAAVVFRGSDPLGDPEQWDKDWIDGDASLLVQTETAQHEAVRDFMAEYRDQLNGYSSIGATGHSLGGNLAEYFTIVSDEYGLDDNIEQCVALDSPGFSNEFLKEHRDQIARMNADNKMVHYQWSMVGGLLHPVQSSQENIRYADVTDEAKDLGHIVTKHGLEYVKSEGESIVTTKEPPKDFLSWYSSIETKWLDHFPRFLTIPLIWVLGKYGDYYHIVNGSALERYKERRAESMAAQEAAAYPDIYIDTAAYVSMGEESYQAAAALEDIAGELRARHCKQPFSVPAVAGVISPLIPLILSAINKIDDMLDAVSFSANRAAECAEAMKQIGNYFTDTANDFKEAEKTALALVQNWSEKVGTGEKRYE